MSKSVRGSTVIALLALGLAACSDGLTAPEQRNFDPSDALMVKGGSGGKGAAGGQGSGMQEGSRTFTIYPGFGVFEKFGEHILTMPANVVCDPDQSGYGSAYWDTPCARARSAIQVTATWSVVGGRPLISFSPDLRFAPSDNEHQWVHLSLRDKKNIREDLYYTILWFDRATNRWIDESQTDPTLKARATLAGNLVTRRLKHFSDYALWVGLGSYNVTSGLGGDIWGGW